LPGVVEGQWRLAEYVQGLRDIERFSHVYLLYQFDQAEPPSLLVKPFLDDVERGVFATRSPSRPNPIALSVVELLARKDNLLYVDGLDVLDGTPLLDISHTRLALIILKRHETAGRTVSTTRSLRSGADGGANGLWEPCQRHEVLCSFPQGK
jgi:tRNA (Thr-GGU) A37 N-methylase